MAGGKQPFLVYLCLWKTQFSSGHIYCPIFFSLVSAFSGCVFIQQRRAELFSLSEVLAPPKSNDAMLIVPNVPVIRTCLKCGPVYTDWPLAPAHHTQLEVATFLYFFPVLKQSKCLFLCRLSPASAFLCISSY